MAKSTMTELFQEIEDDVASIIAEMKNTGVPPIALNIVQKTLPVFMQGAVLAQATDVDPDDIETAYANSFLIAMSYLYRRRFKKRADAIAAAQNTVNAIAAELGNNVVHDFPEILKVPTTGKPH